jgi:hypothetical protein
MIRDFDPTTLPTAPAIDLDAEKAALGVERLTLRRPTWSQLTGDMVHVRVTVRYWRGKEKITMEDLGLENASPDFQALVRERMALGHHRLAPAELLGKLHSLEVTRGNVCARYGVRSPWDGWMIYRRNWPQWKAAIDQARTEFYEAAETLVETRAAWVEEALVLYRQAALAEGLSEATASARTARIEAAIPPAEVIRARLLFDYAVELIEAPKLAETGDLERLEARQRQAEYQLSQINERIRENSARLHSNEEWQLAQQRLQAERDRAAIDLEIHRAAAESAASARTREFEEACADLAAKVWEGAGAVAFGILKSLRLKEGSAARVYPAQVQALRSLVEDLRCWNIMGDQRIDLLIEQANAILPAGEGTPVDAATALAWAEETHAYYRLMAAQAGRQVRTGGRLSAHEEALLTEPLPESRVRRAVARFEPDLAPALAPAPESRARRAV